MSWKNILKEYRDTIELVKEMDTTRAGRIQYIVTHPRNYVSSGVLSYILSNSR